MRIVEGKKSLPLFAPQEAFSNGVVEQTGEWVEVTQDVEAADGFVVDAELCPGEDFAEFLVGSEAARKGDEGVGQLGHEGFALVHRGDDPQIGAAVGQLAIDEHLRDDADDLTAGGERGVGQDAHQADITGTVHEADAALAEKLAERCRGLSVFGAVADARSAEDADGAE